VITAQELVGQTLQAAVNAKAQLFAFEENHCHMTPCFGAYQDGELWANLGGHEDDCVHAARYLAATRNADSFVFMFDKGLPDGSDALVESLVVLHVAAAKGPGADIVTFRLLPYETHGCALSFHTDHPYYRLEYDFETIQPYLLPGVIMKSAIPAGLPGDTSRWEPQTPRRQRIGALLAARWGLNVELHFPAPDQRVYPN
jgi:hypothetical protein